MPIREELAEHNEEMLFLDPPEQFDKCLVGVVNRYGMEPVACYDYEKIIDMLMEDGCTHEEAIDYFEYNIIGAWVGESTPAFIYQHKEVECQETVPVS